MSVSVGDIMKMATAQQTTPYHLQRMAEVCLFLGLPGGRGSHLCLVFGQAISRQRNQRKHPEQNRRKAHNSLVALLPLRLDAQVRARFFKGHIYAQTPHEPTKNLNQFMCRSSRKKGTHLKFLPAHRAPAPSGLPQMAYRSCNCCRAVA